MEPANPGALLTGLFATSAINAASAKTPPATLSPRRTGRTLGQVLNQAAGVGLAWGISIVGTLVLLFVVDKLMRLARFARQEAEGLGHHTPRRGRLDLNT